jgi:ABC-type methionine transport system ATPase subunit
VQRTVAAPALALRPSYLACGEMTSLPDASTTAALLRH